MSRITRLLHLFSAWAVIFLLATIPVMSRNAQEAFAAEVLRQATRIFEAKHRPVSYIPHGSVKELYDSVDPEIIISGPAGTGKSRGILEKINDTCWRYPGTRVLIIRKTRESLTDSTLVTFERFVLGEDNPIVNGLRRENRHAYHYPNKSEIVLGGMNKATRVLSSEYDIIYVPECIELSEPEWEILTTRLGRAGVVPLDEQQLIGDTNPDVPTHWVIQRAERGSVRMIESRHEDNPVLFDRVKGQWTKAGRIYLSRLDKLTGVRYQRYRLGLWVAAEGVVYEDYDAQVHLIDRFDIPAQWRRFRAIDFGFTNPFVCQWWALRPDDDALILYREIYQTNLLVEDAAKWIKQLDEGEYVEFTVADHDAEDRATLERYGISTRTAQKDISPGLQAVQLRLRHDENSLPRLYFMRDSVVRVDAALADAKKPTSTVEEIVGYCWPKGSDGRPIKETPVKLDDHGVDPMRYLVMELDGAPTFKYEFVSIDETPDKTPEQIALEKWVNENAA